jgi:hypothetical protein
MNRCIALEADSGLGCGCHCAALKSLAASSPENKRAIAAAGGVAAVVGAMRAHPAAAGVQQWGCFGAWGPVCWLVLVASRDSEPVRLLSVKLSVRWYTHYSHSRSLHHSVR